MFCVNARKARILVIGFGRKAHWIITSRQPTTQPSHFLSLFVNYRRTILQIVTTLHFYSIIVSRNLIPDTQSELFLYLATLCLGGHSVNLRVFVVNHPAPATSSAIPHLAASASSSSAYRGIDATIGSLPAQTCQSQPQYAAYDSLS